MGKRGCATLSIVAINILIWIINIIAGGGSTWGLFISGGGYLKEYGEVAFGYIFEQGEWWRFLTSGYLHIGVIHLLCNMFALVIIGSKVEEYVGSIRLGVLYNIGTVITTLLWCLIFRNRSIVGASLGIFVLIGILFGLYMFNHQKEKYFLTHSGKRYLLCYIVLGCVLGIGTIVAHLIGFVVGVLLSVFLDRRKSVN